MHNNSQQRSHAEQAIKEEGDDNNEMDNEIVKPLPKKRKVEQKEEFYLSAVPKRQAYEKGYIYAVSSFEYQSG